MLRPSWFIFMVLTLALQAGGCTATPINLPFNEMGGPAADAAMLQDSSVTKKDGGSSPDQGVAMPDAAAVDGMVDGLTDGLVDGLTDGASDATGEVGAQDGAGAGEAGTTTKDALAGE
jgi:hypothetical protein